MKHRPLNTLEWIILLLFMSAGISLLTYDKLHEEKKKTEAIINGGQILKP